ncbi:MAG: VWA domain-containing protein, partial [Caldilineaceae bacterium]|nr:VWA domain-containing protein [Caldilineaceae bacterium]
MIRLSAITLLVALLIIGGATALLAFTGSSVQATPDPVVAGGAVEVTFTTTVQSGEDLEAVEYRFVLSGASGGDWLCEDVANGTNTGQEYERTFSVNAPSTPGDYTLEARARDDNSGNQCSGSGAFSNIVSTSITVEEPYVEPNPDLPDACGLDVMLILDSSGSIDTAGQVDNVRNAAQSFVNSLAGTGSRLAVVEFASTAYVPIGYTSVNATSIANVFDPYLVEGGDQFNGYEYYDDTLGTGTRWTNWEAAFYQANTNLAPADLVIFFTDGDPTAYGIGSSPDDTGTDSATEAIALSRARLQANITKANGSHIFAVGVAGATFSNFAPITDGSNYLQYVTSNP